MVSYIVLSIFLLVIGGAIAKASYDVTRKRKAVDRENFLCYLADCGTDKDKERVKAIRELEKEVRLRIIESEQVSQILDNKLIRDKLESAAVDVEELKLLLFDGTGDDLAERIEKLESTMDKTKLLGGSDR